MPSFWRTMFNDVYARTMQGEDTDLDGLAREIAAARAPDKDSQPLLKLARFGANRDPSSGSLRYDANVLAVSGCEGDHDSGSMTMQEAARRLDDAGIAHILYSTFSHTAVAPRWRALCPFSKALPPAMRAGLVNRLNGILGGVLARESWVLSQAFFFGQVDGRDPVDIVIGDHEIYIDEDDELDEAALPFRPPGGQAKGGASTDFDALDEAALLDLIQSGEHYYRPAIRLLKLWAGQGIAQADAVANLTSAFDQTPAGKRGKKWTKARRSVAKWAAKAYGGSKQKRDATLRRLVAYFEDAAPWPGMIRLNRFTDTIMVAEPFPPKLGQLAPSTAALGNGLRSLNDPIDVLESMMVVQDQPGFEQGRQELDPRRGDRGRRTSCLSSGDRLAVVAKMGRTRARQ
jgi:hypothetical protein